MQLVPSYFLKAEGYRLLERDMFLYQLSLFLCLLFFSFIAFLSLLSQIYFFCTAIPFFHFLNLHLVFLSPFFSGPSFIFCKTDISFPYFLFQFFFIPFSISLSQSLSVLPREDLEKHMRVKVGERVLQWL